MKNKRFWIINRKKKENQLIHSTEDIYNILEYECSRTNRNNEEFSLIVFIVKNRKKRHFNHFLKVLFKRKRVIDEIGWLDENSLGLVLPGTNNKNARIIGEGMKDTYSSGKLDIKISYYSYPDKWFVENER
jgi:hypothetical protein